MLVVDAVVCFDAGEDRILLVVEASDDFVDAGMPWLEAQLAAQLAIDFLEE
jgi:hypothetical protein